jgi:hypothetical protein
MVDRHVVGFLTCLSLAVHIEGAMGNLRFWAENTRKTHLPPPRPILIPELRPTDLMRAINCWVELIRTERGGLPSLPSVGFSDVDFHCLSLWVWES